ncbi:protein bicaudal D homolog 2-like isoform X2 [Brienomyrus brachyistius]|uniref:protein bicaudal D homolog 2-like isoform X2 n=1 Tax=Brienomyrus brachyistius TaxID=42636 RepID=UPI0020B38001|nr:protein bicaudal D homolog 2-like isoform X2 [Brienomyrus brachyistius]
MTRSAQCVTMLEDGEAGDHIPSLRAEVERLQTELQEASQQNEQAARYGLAMLEESAALKSKHNHLEEEHEALKQEVQQLREALAESVSNMKRTASDGESREETLLRESASKEAALGTRLEELQLELRQARLNLSNVQAESERLGGLCGQFKTDCEHLEMEKGHLRGELKEYKVREMQHLQDNSELEEENVSLQKQISLLKENQVEFEALKLELIQKEEEHEHLKRQLAEAGRLREIAERQLEAALETLEDEREQKNNLRKELAALAINPFDSVSNLELHLGQLEESTEEAGDQDSGYNNRWPQIVFKANGEHCCSTPRNSGIFLQAPAPGLVSDLLSELHLSDSQKLKQQLTQAEKEKGILSSTVKELQEELEVCRKTLAEGQEKMASLTKQLEVFQGCQDHMRGSQGNPEGVERPGVGHHGEGELCELVNGVEQGMLTASEESQLREEIKEATVQYAKLESRYQQEKERWRGEAQELAEKIRQCIQSSQQDQERILALEKEIGATMKVASDSESHLSTTQDELLVFSEELANLYHHICMCSNLTPVRVTLDYYRRGAHAQHSHHGPLRKRRSSEMFTKVSATCSMDSRASPLGDGGDSLPGSPGASSCPSSPTPDFRDPTNVRNLMAVIRNQMKHLQTAEIALTTLKTKYDTEKSAISETMLKLRNELKALKEDAATFSALRTMFASRCDQYVTQIDEMQRQLAIAEDEKKTLNSLLRMAIQQKLALTQRLEDLETPCCSHSGLSSPRRSRSKRLGTPRSGQTSRSPCGCPTRPPRTSPHSSPVRNGSI